jgi:hypothetical protein
MLIELHNECILFASWPVMIRRRLDLPHSRCSCPQHQSSLSLMSIHPSLHDFTHFITPPVRVVSFYNLYPSLCASLPIEPLSNSPFLDSIPCCPPIPSCGLVVPWPHLLYLVPVFVLAFSVLHVPPQTCRCSRVIGHCSGQDLKSLASSPCFGTPTLVRIWNRDPESATKSLSLRIIHR